MLLRALPDNLRGRLLVNAYIRQLNAGKDNVRNLMGMSEFNRKVLRQPGNVSAIYRYLAGDGKHLIPEMVEKNIGNHWYTGLAKKLSSTAVGNGIALNQFLEKTLPKINGSNELAKQFFEAGGQV